MDHVKAHLSLVLILIAAVVSSCGDGTSGGGGSTSGATGTGRVLVIGALGDPDLPGERVGEGAVVLADGVPVGTTNAQGEYLITLPAGAMVDVEVLLPGLVAGRVEQIAVVAGSTVEGVAQLSGHGLVRDSVLQADQEVAGVIPRSMDSLDLWFQFVGVDVPLESVESVQVEASINAAVPIDLADAFAIGPNGHITGTGLSSTWSSLPGGNSEYEMTLSALDTQGFVHHGTLPFRPGLYSIAGKVTAPTSNPGLDVGALDVVLELIGTNVTFKATSSELGNWDLVDLPFGTYSVSSKRVHMGQTYSAIGTAFISSDSLVTLNLATTGDIQGGVNMVEVSPSLLTSPATRTLNPKAKANRAPIANGSGGVSVVSGSQNFRVTDTAMIPIGAQAETVHLEFQVCSDEYPFYVLKQSEFNDNWEVGLFGPNGQLLEFVDRNVNSQIYVEPFWQPSGCTGSIVKEYDVSGFSGDGGDLLLYVSATNIGDSLLPTYVSASVVCVSSTGEGAAQCDIPLRIVSATPSGSTGHYSIPKEGSGVEVNDIQKFFTIKLDGEEGGTLDKVVCQMVHADNPTNVLATLVNQGVDDDAVKKLASDEYRVRVTNKVSNPSTLMGTPPPTSRVKYRFEVLMDYEEGSSRMAERFTSDYTALWRMPSGFSRFGVRDSGLDDWCSKGGYTWLAENGALVTRINDISGEHGKNIGHSTHKKGTDIDIYHYTDLQTGTSLAGMGARNYLAFTSTAKSAAGGDGDALAALTDYVQSEREGLGGLIGNSQVARVIAAIGNSSGVLPSGWAKQLLRTGMVVDGSSLIVDTGLGSWSNPNMMKLKYNSVHNDHSHIDLDDSSLSN